MDEQPPIRKWIVLLNKSPKGPLTETEIHALLEQKILRRNDLAYVIDPEPGQVSDWKLLWQYPEFDRRKDFSPTDSRPKPKPKVERRKDTPSEKHLTAIPPDLSGITPEDLLPRSTSLHVVPQEIADGFVGGSSSFSTASSGSVKWIGGATLMALAAFLYLKLQTPIGRTTASKPTPAVSAPVQTAKPVGRSPSAPQRSSLTRRIAPPPPRQGDRGAAALNAQEEMDRERDEGYIEPGEGDEELYPEEYEGQPGPKDTEGSREGSREVTPNGSNPTRRAFPGGPKIKPGGRAMAQDQIDEEPEEEVDEEEDIQDEPLRDDAD